MIKVIPALGCRRPAQILQSLLDARINGDRVEAVVSYGQRIYEETVPVLNAMASEHNKYEQLRIMRDWGIRAPETYLKEDFLTTERDFCPPWFGRAFRHMGGTDIVPLLSIEDARERQATYDFVTRYTTSVQEYRVWSYRRRHLGSYLKVLTEPQDYRAMGRNYDNGWAFRLAPSGSLPPEALRMAGAAVNCLRLDFGAVDVLRDPVGQFWVLEVNTAPGIESDGRFSIIRLADKIARWRELGFVERSGGEE